MTTRRSRCHTPGTPRTPHAENAENAENAEERRIVRRGLLRLPDELRVPLVLRFQAGMTFAAMADVLACSESTAHERVKRGLDSLRRKLRGLGFAAAGARLPEALATDELPVVPRGLETKLLALGQPVAAASAIATLKMAGVAVGLVSAVAVAVAGILWSSGGRTPAIVPAAVAADAGNASSAGEPNARPDAAAMQDPARRPVPAGSSTARGAGDPAAGVEPEPETEDFPTGRIEGVAEDENGVPLPGAVVEARSLESRGKQARFSAEARTAADGRFALEVPVATDGGQAYRVHVHEPDYVIWRSARLTVAADRPVPFQTAQLRRWAADRPGAFRLLVTVTDEAGNPVGQAAVRVYRRQPRKPVGEHDPVEAGGVTDAAGRVMLAGAHLGEKELRVDARRQGFGPLELELAIDAEGDHDRAVRLAPGLTIEGVVRPAAAAETLDERIAVQAVAEDGGGTSAHAFCELDGRFVIRGLGAGRHVLRSSPQKWSPFTLDGVEAGSMGVVLEVKRRRDPIDHGLHGAEIHGVLRDRDTGAPVDASIWGVETVLVGDGVEDWRTELLSDLLLPRPVQRAYFGEVPPPGHAFHLVGLGPGRHLVVVRLKGYGLAVAGPFDLSEDTLVADVVVELGRGGTVRGVVTDPSGNPVPGAVVFLGPDDDVTRKKVEQTDDALRDSAGRDSLHLGAQVLTDAAGRFLFEHAFTGAPLGCFAAHADWEPVRAGPAALREGAERRVELRFVRARGR